jgi:YggT family protein
MNIGVFLIGAINIAFKVFQLVILARILISWVRADPYNRIVQGLHNLTEPILAPIRRRLPPTGMFDLSPLIVIIASIVLNQLIVQVLSNLFFR